MKELKENITHDQLLSLLKESGNRVDVINWLKSIEPTHDDVKGVKLFLEMNDWNYTKLEQFVLKSENSFSNFDGIKTKNKSNKTLLKVAAVLVPLIIMGSYFFSNQIGSNSDLYAKYYEKEVGLPVLMSSNVNKQFNEAMNAFRDADFEYALSGFKSLFSENSKNDTLIYFIGCSQMELNDISSAISNFEKVPEKSVYKEKAEYRLILMYIEDSNIDKAKKLLNLIVAQQEHAYNEQVKVILKEDIFN